MTNEKDVLTLEELVKTSVDYVQGKTNEKALDALGQRMTVRGYMPILEKLRLMMGIIFNMNAMDVEAEEVRVVSMQKDLFFNVLLAGYALIDTSNEELKTYDSYDLLYPLFAPYILQYCEHDYKQLVEMIEKSLNIYNMKELDSLFASVNYQALKDAQAENVKLMESLEKNKEVLAELRKVYELTHPNLKGTYDAIEKVALKEMNEVATQAINGTKDETNDT